MVVETKRTITWILIAFAAILFAALIQPVFSHAATGINSQISFEGKLVNASGVNIPDGTYNMEFKIYQDGTGCVSSGTSPCGGTLKWTEDHLVSATTAVTVTAGTFQVNLGSVTPFATNIDWNQDSLWLSMNVGGTATTAVWDGEMTPFIRLTSVPYALNAGMVNGLTASQLIQLSPGTAQSGNINVTGSVKAGSLALTAGGTIDTQAAGSLTIGTTASTITLGTGTAAETINIGSSTAKDTINIGTAGGNDAIVLGNSAAGANTTIQGGVTSLFVGNAGVGINTATPVAALDVSGSISSLGTGQRNYLNTFQSFYAGTTTGELEIITPNGWFSGSSQLRIQIDGYDNSAATGEWQAVIGSSLTAGGGYSTTSSEIHGMPPFTTARLGYDTALSKMVILLGGISTTWKGAQVSVSQIGVSGATSLDKWDTDYNGGYSSAFLTTESGLSNITTNTTQILATNATAFVQGGNSFGTTASLGTADGNSLQLLTAGSAKLTITSAGAASFTSTLSSVGFSTTAGLTSTGGAVSLTGSAASSLTTSTGNALTVTSGAAATWGSSAGLLTVQGAGGLTLQSGAGTALTLTANAASTWSSTSDLTIQAGNTNNLSIDTAGDGSINVGNTNAATVNIGATGSTVNAANINVGASYGAAQTINIGGYGTNSGTSNSGTVVTVQAGATSLSVQNSGVTVQSFTNTATAFQVENSSGVPIFLVDTANSVSGNLLYNGGFELGTSGALPTYWNAVNPSGTTTVVKNTNAPNHYGGLASALVTMSGVSGQGLSTAPFTGPTVLPTSTTYTLSFYAQSVSGLTSSSNYGISYNGAASTACAAGVTLNTSGFQRITCTANTTAATSSVAIVINAATATTVYIDAVQLTQGSIAKAATNGEIQLRGDVASPVVFQALSNSTSAFQVNSYSATAPISELMVDTLNNVVQIGSGTANTNGVTLRLNNYSNGTTEPTVSNGAMYYNAAMNSFRCGTAGVWVSCGGLNISNIVTAACTVSTTATACAPNNYFTSAAPTIPANYCTPGRVIHLIVNGVYSNSTTASNLTFGVTWGGTAVGGTSQAMATLASAANRGWRVDYYITCVSTTTITGEGVATVGNAATAPFAVTSDMPQSGTTTVTTTTAQALSVTLKWGATTAGNAATIQQFIVQGM